MVSKRVRKEIATAWGFVEEGKVQELAQKGWQKGFREGMQEVHEFLKQGHSVEEAKKHFALSGAR